MILKKLRIRFIIINMCLVSVVLIGIFLANTISIAKEIASTSYSSLTEDRKRIDLFVLEDNIRRKDPRQSSFPIDIIWLRVSDESINVLDESTTTSYTDEYIQEIIDEAIETGNSKGLLKNYDLRFQIFQAPNNDILIGFIDISYEHAFIYDQVTNYLFIGLGSLAVFFIISFFLSKVVISPVDKAFKQQQQFVSDASHELKTPITVILANTSIIQNKKDDRNTYKWVNYIDKEANRMKKLVEDLLFLARLDESDKIMLDTKFNLSDALYECILPFEPVAFESGVSIENTIAGDVFIKGNMDQIKRLILILLDNACKYSPTGCKISINLKTANNKALLSVHNYGAPIPDNELPNIFDRFYRVDKARQRNSNSYGLGLSMAKKIVDAHKGEISAVSSEKAGTTFTIVLPAI